MSITVVIPTTGSREAMLARAIGAVRAQSLPVSEVLVVVDGAQTLTDRISSAHPEALVISTGQRLGASGARNCGAAHAGGEFLAFLDDDDAWKPTYLEAVFAHGDNFDVALTAFEKHRPQDIAPEKIPPEELRAEHFLVRNPGLRGSNLVITRRAFDVVGGFDETFLAFNDMDFGVRLSDSGPWRYRRVVEHLVEFHSHRGPRLSTAGGHANREGLASFWRRYRARMTTAQREAFCKRALDIWQLDPRELAPSTREQGSRSQHHPIVSDEE